MHTMLRKAAIRIVMFLSTSAMLGQVATGIYPNGTFDKQGFDAINVGNLNAHLSIPVLNKAGRGLPFYYNLAYDSSVWYPSSTSGSPAWMPVQGFGWAGDTQIASGYVSFSQNTKTEVEAQSTCELVFNSGFVYHDPFGVQHFFGGLTENIIALKGTCTTQGQPLPSYSHLAYDGSGYTINVTDYSSVTLTSASQKLISPPLQISTGSASVTDSNGNELTTNGSGQFTDTTGNVVLTVAGSAPNPHTFTYTDTTGTARAAEMTYRTYTVQTAFGCSGIGEYGPTSTPLVNTVTLPDGSTYTFSYEQTPGAPGNVTGRLASVELPQGGPSATAIAAEVTASSAPTGAPQG